MARMGSLPFISWILLSVLWLPFVFTGEIPDIVDAFFETAKWINDSRFWYYARPFSPCAFFIIFEASSLGRLGWGACIRACDSAQIMVLSRCSSCLPCLGNSYHLRPLARLYLVIAMTAILTIILVIFQNALWCLAFIVWRLGQVVSGYNTLSSAIFVISRSLSVDGFGQLLYIHSSILLRRYR